MSVTYKVFKNKKVEHDYRNAACFSACYQNLGSYDDLEFEIQKSYVKNNYYKQYLTDEEVQRYLQLLKQMGLNFSIKEENDNVTIFNIPLNKNSTAHNKMILNCLRYLCEDSFPGIVRNFLMTVDEPDCNLYTKLVIAHDSIPRGNVNHMFVPWYSFAQPMTDQEFKERIIDNNSNSSLNVIVKSSKVPFCLAEKTLLNDLFKEKASFKKIYKKYNELCNKKEDEFS